jgi:hypothetical protein
MMMEGIATVGGRRLPPDGDKHQWTWVVQQWWRRVDRHLARWDVANEPTPSVVRGPRVVEKYNVVVVRAVNLGKHKQAGKSRSLCIDYFYFAWCYVVC